MYLNCYFVFAIGLSRHQHAAHSREGARRRSRIRGVAAGASRWTVELVLAGSAMPKFPAGLQDPRYPFEEPPESCDFIGANLVTRAVWANGEAGYV